MKKPLSLPKGKRRTSAPKGKPSTATRAAGRPVGDAKQSAVRRAFFTRGMHLMKQLAKETPEEVLSEALGKATALDTWAHPRPRRMLTSMRRRGRARCMTIRMSQVD